MSEVEFDYACCSVVVVVVVVLVCFVDFVDKSFERWRQLLASSRSSITRD